MPRTDRNRTDPVRFSSSAHIRFETERLGRCPNRAHCSLRNIYRFFWPNYKYLTTEMVRIAQPNNLVVSSNLSIRKFVDSSNSQTFRNLKSQAPNPKQISNSNIQ